MKSVLVSMMLLLVMSQGIAQRRRIGEERVGVENSTRSEVHIDHSPFGPRDLPSLVADADIIITGIVSDILPAERSQSDRNLLVTPVVMTVSSLLKSKLGTPEQVVIRQFGGTLGTHTQTVVDQPAFQKGEQYVLFLKPVVGSTEERHDPIGLYSGRFRVLSGKVYPTNIESQLGQPHVGKDVTAFENEIVNLVNAEPRR